MPKTVKLQPPKRRELDQDVRYWLQAPAFVLNPRAILVHRVRHVCTIWFNGQPSHDSVHYWCGNQASYRRAK